MIDAASEMLTSRRCSHVRKRSWDAEGLSVAQCDALLYLPGATKEELERALRIPALSGGWKSSFEAILRQMTQPGPHTGNAGLTSAEQMVTAAPGFRPLKVARIDRESSSVVSVVLEPADGNPLTIPLPGQFVVLQVRPEADSRQLLRSYSLSGNQAAVRRRGARQSTGCWTTPDFAAARIGSDPGHAEGQTLWLERSVAAQAPDGRGGQLHTAPMEGIKRLRD